MSSILKQITEWQYHAHVLIIVAGLIAYMHVLGIHQIHSSVLMVVGLYVAVVVLDVVAHTVMGLSGWAD